MFALAAAQTAQAAYQAWVGSRSLPCYWDDQANWNYNSSGWKSSWNFPQNGCIWNINNSLRTFNSTWNNSRTITFRTFDSSNVGSAVRIDAAASDKPIIFVSSDETESCGYNGGKNLLLSDYTDADAYLEIQSGKYVFGAISLGNKESKTGSLKITGGAFQGSTIAVGNTSSAVGLLTVAGSSAKATATGKISLNNGTVSVKSGGKLNCQTWFAVGSLANKTGTLEIDGGEVETTANRMTIGDVDGATGIVKIKNGGKYSNTGSSTIGLTVGQQETGELEVDGGEVELGTRTLDLCDNASATATVTVKNDGIIKMKGVQYGAGTGGATITIDGGVLKATEDNVNFIPAHDSLNVYVGSNGATFDTDGHAITIPCTITGEGGLTLSGAGTTTISANQSYTGTTTVSKGTTLAVSGVTLAGPLSLEAGSKLNLVNYSGVSLIAASALALPESGTVALTLNGGAFPAGEYVICSAFDGVTVSDGDKFVPSTGGKAASWSIVDNKLILTVSTVSSAQDFTWAGGAAVNWSDANVWMNADAAATWADNNNAIFNTANATVTLNNDVTAAGVVFSADATIVTNGTDAAMLTVPTVSVAQNVSATIAVPTSGALEKTGAGTLTLTESRTDATTVTAGTLKMDGATVSTLTLGTNGGAPVVFDYGGQTKVGDVNSYLVKGSCVTLTNGTFTMSNLNDGTALPSVLTIAKDATLLSTSGTALFDAAGEATVNIAGGTWRKSSNSKTTIQDYSANGRLNINVTDGGTFASQWDIYCMVYEGTEVPETPSLYIKLVESTLAARNFYFPNVINQPADKLPVRPTGVLAATNSTITVATTFAIGRNTQDEEKTAGSFTADFERCTITAKTFAVYHDRPLNNARFNDTRFVFNAASGSIAASDGEANWITVGDNGLTLDTQAYACSLNANLGGSGAVTKIGTGMLTVTSNQTSTAAFNVNEGTNAVNGGVSISRPMTIASGATLKVNATDTVCISSLTPAAGSTLDIASYNGKTPLALTLLTLPAEGRVNLTLNGDAFPQGVYAVCSAPGVTESDGAKFAPSTGTLGTTWRVENNALILIVGEVSVNYWTGRGGDSKMSTAANWLNGVPAAGATVFIQSTGGAIVNDIENFAPASITFGYGTDTVTISGNAITGVAAITNLSTTASHTINAPVAFAEKIFVVQGAMSWEQKANPSINFAGGVTGTTFADGTARYLNGVFNLSTGEGWVANTQGSNNRWGLPAGSSLTLPSATDTSELALGDSTAGGAFTTGVMRTSARLLCWNYGEYVVTNEFTATFPASATHYCGWDNISNGKFKFEKMTLEGEYGSPFKFGNERNVDDNGTQRFYIGKGGLCFADGAARNLRYETGGAKNGAIVRIDPWHGDYTIHTKSASNPTDFTVSAKTYFGTTDEDGNACTVTDEGIINSWGDAAQIHIDGNGKFVVNAVCAATCPVTVEGNATLSINAGKTLTTGATTVNSGATLEVAESGTVALGGDLTLKAGAALGFNYTTRNKPVLNLTDKSVTFEEGETATVVVKISATADKRPLAGENVLTSGGKFEGVTVTLAPGAPNWVKGIAVEDGEIVLDVKPIGTKITVR